MIESGYSVFLLKIPLFQGVYGTSNDFEAELVELNSMFFSFHFAKTDTHSLASVKFMGYPSNLWGTRQIYGVPVKFMGITVKFMYISRKICLVTILC